jgi:hypothetical protein
MTGMEIRARIQELGKRRKEICPVGQFVYTPELREIDEEILWLREQCKHEITQVDEFNVKFCVFCGKDL